jgi:hypothetical protein
MRRAAKVAAVVCVVNFAAYVLIAALLGGDAINGRVAEGHYYLAMHGHSTEVSRGVFEYSRWHTYLLWTTFAIAIVLALFARTAKSDAA